MKFWKLRLVWAIVQMALKTWDFADVNGDKTIVPLLTLTRSLEDSQGCQSYGRTVVLSEHLQRQEQQRRENQLYFSALCDQ